MKTDAKNTTTPLPTHDQAALKSQNRPVAPLGSLMRFPRAGLLAAAVATAALGQVALAQPGGEKPALEDSTVVFDADFFTQFQPVSVNDMIDRIPGIGLALGGGGGNRRGIGGGGNEILINGQRITGKSNDSRAQLRRIAADQVDYIEIIRGTSDKIDVRGGGQIVNIVLLEAASRSSFAAEVNTDLLQDGTLSPGGRFSFTGQTGNFNYVFAAESEPRFQAADTFEVSRGPNGELLETRSEEIDQDQNQLQASMNLGYAFTNTLVQFNALMGETSPPTDINRVITDFRGDEVQVSNVREGNQFLRENWEIGGDIEHEFNSGSKFRLLFLVNDNETDFTRERFDVLDSGDDKDLFIRSLGRDRERIVRTSYTFDIGNDQGLEMGVEGAQTIRDNGLLVGSRSNAGLPSAETGNLPPTDIDNAFSSVEEMRFEYFGIHNWQMNDRMALESQLIYEDSTIEQSGDVNNARSFGFLRPRVDYRFDITPSMQLRATIEKEVSQLSFSDFSVSADGSDDDQNIQGGNPEVRQEQTWAYDLNFEYRLPEGLGVVNTQLYYRDVTDRIGRIDVSTSDDNLLSARGNIGDGYRYGMNVEGSSKLTYLGLPNALATLRIGVGDSEITDPFLGTERRMRRFPSRWSTRASFRHDYQPWNFSYGFNYSFSDQQGDNNRSFDLFDIERDYEEYNLSMFVEKRAFGGVTFRMDLQNANDRANCRERTRFVGRISAGVVEEIEDFCRTDGVRYAFRVRHTF